jgi:hypothetical protein
VTDLDRRHAEQRGARDVEAAGDGELRLIEALRAVPGEVRIAEQQPVAMVPRPGASDRDRVAAVPGRSSRRAAGPTPRSVRTARPGGRAPAIAWMAISLELTIDTCSSRRFTVAAVIGFTQPLPRQVGSVTPSAPPTRSRYRLYPAAYPRTSSRAIALWPSGGRRATSRSTVPESMICFQKRSEARFVDAAAGRSEMPSGPNQRDRSAFTVA